MNTQRIQDWAAARGMACRVVPIDTLEMVRARLERLAADGLLDPGFVRGQLSAFRYLEGRSVKDPRSLILLALPRPAHVVGFRLGDRELNLVLPPTYVRYGATFDLVRDWFRTDFGLAPEQADIVHAPLKSLAAAGGLIRYGRNNVGYVPGMGSFCQLVGLATAFPLEPSGELFRIEDRSLEACRNCNACAKACLCGAIGTDRFMLRAERCFTLLSESSEPIPETITWPSRDCLIGCLKCQEICPANKGLLKREHTGLTFDSRETEVMLSDPEERETDIWTGFRASFAALSTTEDIKVFARNLRFIVNGKHN